MKSQRDTCEEVVLCADACGTPVVATYRDFLLSQEYVQIVQTLLFFVCCQDQSHGPGMWQQLGLFAVLVGMEITVGCMRTPYCIFGRSC